MLNAPAPNRLENINFRDQKIPFSFKFKFVKTETKQSSLGIYRLKRKERPLNEKCQALTTNE